MIIGSDGNLEITSLMYKLFYILHYS